MVCIVRALAEDENKAQRAEHGLDLALLDGVTWPDYLWDYLRLVYNPLGRLSAASASLPNTSIWVGMTVGLTCTYSIPADIPCSATTAHD